MKKTAGFWSCLLFTGTHPVVAVRHRSPYLTTADKLEALEQYGTVWNIAWAATKKGIGKDKALLGLLGLAGPQVRCHKISPVLEATYTYTVGVWFPRLCLVIDSSVLPTA